METVLPLAFAVVLAILAFYFQGRFTIFPFDFEIRPPEFCSADIQLNGKFGLETRGRTVLGGPQSFQRISKETWRLGLARCVQGD